MSKFNNENKYYIFDNFNNCLSNEEYDNCNNSNLNVEKLRENRNNILKRTYLFLGHEDFMKLIHTTSNCAIWMLLGDREKPNCNNHHCCECWEKVVREELLR